MEKVPPELIGSEHQEKNILGRGASRAKTDAWPLPGVFKEQGDQWLETSE